MNDATQRFSNRVEDYVKYRPGYPPEVISFIESNCQLKKGAAVADIGLGTGIFAKLLLDKGYQIYGVEPNEPMRSAAESYLKDYARFTAVDGTSEHSSLPNHSVDLVTAATAFHWFKREETHAEFERILRPGGYVVLLWNERKTDADPFADAYELLLRQLPDYTHVNAKYSSYENLKEFFGNDSLKQASFANYQTFNAEGLAGRARSSSFVPKPDTEEGVLFHQQLMEIFNQYQENGQVTFYYNTIVYIGQL